MMRELKGHIIPDTKFCFPFRMILAGSSGSGKTHFAGNLLSDDTLFEEKISSIVYYYPCYLEKAPVKWHKTFNVPVSYQVGLPTKDDLVKLPKRTCVVLDDSYDEAINSKCIDHLFRVISGKRKISVIIMTQNNFSKGRYGRDIRNSCNFAVLFRNCCDTSINENIARMAGLDKAYKAASLANEGVKYPYLFIDQSQQGQLSNYRMYSNIFGRYKEVWSVKGMKGYVVAAQDFETFFDVFSDEKTYTAVENANPQSTEVVANGGQANTSAESEHNWNTSTESDGETNPTYYKRDETKQKKQKKRVYRMKYDKAGQKNCERNRKERHREQCKKEKRRRPSTSSESESETDRRRTSESNRRRRRSKSDWQRKSVIQSSDSDDQRQSTQYGGFIFQN